MATGSDSAALQELWANAYEGWVSPPGAASTGAVYLAPVEPGSSTSAMLVDDGVKPWVDSVFELIDEHNGVFGVTAFNPAGQDKPLKENLEQNKLLESDIQALCAETGGSSTYWRSFGFASDWHEKGFTVAASESKVVDLAKKYGQGAIYKFYRASTGSGAPFMRATVPALLPDTEADVPCSPCARPGIDRADPDWVPAE